MKAKVYMRVARKSSSKRGFIVEGKPTPSYRPLMDSNGGALPTVAFALEMDIPDKMFKVAENVLATIEIPESAAQVAAEVTVADG